jgi:hypothetical protein
MDARGAPLHAAQCAITACAARAQPAATEQPAAAAHPPRAVGVREVQRKGGARFKAELLKASNPDVEQTLSSTHDTMLSAARAYDEMKRTLALRQVTTLGKSNVRIELNFPKKGEARWQEVQGLPKKRGRPCPHCGKGCPVFADSSGRTKTRFRLRGRGKENDRSFPTAKQACDAWREVCGGAAKAAR